MTDQDIDGFEFLEDAFRKAKTYLLSSMDAQVFSAYIEPLMLGKLDEESNVLTVFAPSRLVITQVEENFLLKLQALLIEITKSPNLLLELSLDDSAIATSQGYVVKRVRPQVVPLVQATPSEQITPNESFISGINSRYTFSDFVVGNNNQFCHAASMRVAERPGQSYNPLFIYGGVGLGKTHLLHAIGNAVLEKNPAAKVLYISSETFTNELILALRNAKMEEFKKKMREIEVLLIDDIQFISGKERTQEEFFHTFNALYGAKRQIVLTSDKIPSEIVGIEERLQTRFSWGLTADLQAPDFETRVAIVNQKAQLDKVSLPEEVAHFIAEHVSSNVRELEGALTRVSAMSSIRNVPISLEMTKESLKHLFQPKTIVLTVTEIQKSVATYFGIKVSEIVSKRRTKNLSFPRHIAMYLCRKHTTCSYPEIGEQFGGRDHSSVIHAASVVSTKLKSDLQVKSLVETLEKNLIS